MKVPPGSRALFAFLAALRLHRVLLVSRLKGALLFWPVVLVDLATVALLVLMRAQVRSLLRALGLAGAPELLPDVLALPLVVGLALVDHVLVVFLRTSVVVSSLSAAKVSSLLLLLLPNASIVDWRLAGLLGGLGGGAVVVGLYGAVRLMRRAERGGRRFLVRVCLPGLALQLLAQLAAARYQLTPSPMLLEPTLALRCAGPALGLTGGAHAEAPWVGRLLDAHRAPLAPALPGEPLSNIVVVLMESTRASATSLFPPHFATTPFLAELAAEPGALVLRNYHAPVANTNKALFTAMCGLPSLDAGLTEAEYGGLMDGCLGALLGSEYDRLFATSSTLSAQDLMGFRTLVDTDVELAFEDDAALRAAYEARYPGGDPLQRVNYLGVGADAMLMVLERDLAQREDRRPLFLVVHAVDSHVPYRPPLNWNARKDLATRQQLKLAHVPSTAGDDFMMYLNGVAKLDSMAARVFAMLKERGVTRDNSWMLVVGDHGESFQEHGAQCRTHGTCPLGEETRVPFVLVGPRPVEVPSQALFSHLDLKPTLLGLLGRPQQHSEWAFSSMPGFLGAAMETAPQGHEEMYAWTTLRTAAQAVVRGDGQRAVLQSGYRAHYRAVPETLWDEKSRGGRLSVAALTDFFSRLGAFEAVVLEEGPNMRVAWLMRERMKAYFAAKERRKARDAGRKGGKGQKHGKTKKKKKKPKSSARG